MINKNPASVLAANVGAVRETLQGVYDAWPTYDADAFAALYVEDATEVPAERQRFATWVLTKQDGKWLVAAYHNCPAH